MIASFITHNHSFGRCITLVFNEGSYATHHGMNSWSIYDNEGYLAGWFDTFGKKFLNNDDVVVSFEKYKQCTMVLRYLDKTPGKIGYIEE